jgi:hypothetical protein
VYLKTVLNCRVFNLKSFLYKLNLMDCLDVLDWNSQFLADENELRTGGIAVLGEFFAHIGAYDNAREISYDGEPPPNGEAGTWNVNQVPGMVSSLGHRYK